MTKEVEMVVANARYEICKSNECGKFSKDFCSLFKGGCGCHLNPNRNMPARTKWMNLGCHDGYWHPVSQPELIELHNMLLEEE